jgi:hypothetical protein
MNEHERAAYCVLLINAEQLRALVSSARSSLHPLNLTDETLDAIGTAVNALHAAQRSMEQ